MENSDFIVKKNVLVEYTGNSKNWVIPDGIEMDGLVLNEVYFYGYFK